MDSADVKGFRVIDAKLGRDRRCSFTGMLFILSSMPYIHEVGREMKFSKYHDQGGLGITGGGRNSFTPSNSPISIPRNSSCWGHRELTHSWILVCRLDTCIKPAICKKLK